MNELELSKRLRTDDGDNQPVIGPGGKPGFWCQYDGCFIEAENVNAARVLYWNHIRDRAFTAIQTHNPDGIRLHHALKEIERLKAEVASLEKYYNWAASIIGDDHAVT